MFRPLHPLPISIPPTKRHQTQSSGRERVGGFLGPPSPLLLWYQLLPSWVLTLSLDDLLWQLLALEGFLGGGPWWGGPWPPLPASIHLSLLRQVAVCLPSPQGQSEVAGSPVTMPLSWIKNGEPGTSLVVQWLRIRLPMQGTRVRALVREDPTGHEATKPVRHNY